MIVTGEGSPVCCSTCATLPRSNFRGIFALSSIARLYAGEPLLNPEGGWVALRSAVEQATLALGQWVKLFAPPPVVAKAIQASSLCHFLELYDDLEVASAAFPDPDALRQQPSVKVPVLMSEVNSEVTIIFRTYAAGNAAISGAGTLWVRHVAGVPSGSCVSPVLVQRTEHPRS